jgi:hypothetical protein
MNPMYYLIPAAPVVTPQYDAAGNITALCLDIESERVVQRQRKFAYSIGGPAVAVGGLLLMKDKPLFGLFVAALGGACTYWHLASYMKVEQVLQSATPSSPTSSS